MKVWTVEAGDKLVALIWATNKRAARKMAKQQAESYIAGFGDPRPIAEGTPEYDGDFKYASVLDALESKTGAFEEPLDSSCWILR